MKILAVDSSGAPASVALLDDQKLIAVSYQNTGFTHSRTLLPMIDTLLENADFTIQDIDVFACASGPGSFTGIRIGVSTIKGFAFAEEKPCAAVSTLEGMAWNLLFTDRIICPVMDARAGQVYNALFCVKDGKIERFCPDRTISIELLTEELLRLGGKYILVGDGSALCYNNLSEKGMNVLIPPENLLYQNAYGVAHAAFSMAVSGRLIDVGELSPTYLRLSQAERERLKKIQCKSI
ncbi:MAG: tRNA (adenosine(37)-N6)-threonylcarbamoyltransferase complex dimerization subunit type 1 TsaB [Clostridiales bacterium]|nr:tRNA (adenosine(37)-N6)-threonylcarbamoyltransferase complex dimerization subunit type 1 TsaB [Clostridiales bacterium]